MSQTKKRPDTSSVQYRFRQLLVAAVARVLYHDEQRDQTTLNTDWLYWLLQLHKGVPRQRITTLPLPQQVCDMDAKLPLRTACTDAAQHYALMSQLSALIWALAGHTASAAGITLDRRKLPFPPGIWYQFVVRGRQDLAVEIEIAAAIRCNSGDAAELAGTPAAAPLLQSDPCREEAQLLVSVLNDLLTLPERFSLDSWNRRLRTALVLSLSAGLPAAWLATPLALTLRRQALDGDVLALAALLDLAEDAEIPVTRRRHLLLLLG